jgi:hypothetical protein
MAMFRLVPATACQCKLDGDSLAGNSWICYRQFVVVRLQYRMDVQVEWGRAHPGRVTDSELSTSAKRQLFTLFDFTTSTSKVKST